MRRRGEVSLFEMLKQPQLQKERDSVLAKQVESSNTANEILLVKAVRPESKAAPSSLLGSRVSPGSVSAPASGAARPNLHHRFARALAVFWPRQRQLTLTPPLVEPAASASAAREKSTKVDEPLQRARADAGARVRDSAAVTSGLASHPRLRALAATELTSVATRVDGEGVSSWLNQRQELRNATLVMATIGIVSALAVAFGAGRAFRSEFEARQEYLRQTYANDPPQWARDLNKGQYPKAEVREVKSSGALLVNGSEATTDDPKASAAAQSYYIPIATIPRSTKAGEKIDDLFSHIERSLGRKLGQLLGSREVDNGSKQLYAGPFADRKLAEELLVQIRKVPKYLGTEFDSLIVEKFPAARN